MQLLLEQLINGLTIGSFYALIALGYTMVYGVLRFINFAHSDVLIAVWDGEPARGRGGTAEVAAQAIVTGTGLVHLPPDPGQECRLVWSAFDPDVLTVDDNQGVSRPCDAHHLDALLRNIMLPPNDPDERTFLRRFYAERVHPFRARIEYPLLLSIFGVRRIRVGDIAESRCQKQIEEEWARRSSGRSS